MLNNKTLKRDDKESFADFLVNRFDPEYEYTSKQKEMDTRDFRVEKPKRVDIISRYDEFKNFEQSDSYRHTQIATDLLSQNFDVTEDQLCNTLQTQYHLSKNESNEVLRNLANSRDVEVRRGTFDKVVKLDELAKIG